jgi:hypothetical protein
VCCNALFNCGQRLELEPTTISPETYTLERISPTRSIDVIGNLVGFFHSSCCVFAGLRDVLAASAVAFLSAFEFSSSRFFNGGSLCDFFSSLPRFYSLGMLFFCCFFSSLVYLF